MPVMPLINMVSPRYSLAVFPGTEPTEAITERLLELLRNGVTVYLSSSVMPQAAAFGPFVKAQLLHVFRRRDPARVGTGLVVDGLRSDSDRHLMESLDRDHEPLPGHGFRPFNFQQYQVEHASADENLSVMAGAGTGKTRTMVQRVLFLLHTCEGLEPRDLAMITFTRDAAHELRSRLRDALVARYVATHSPRYRDLLQAMGDMAIQTIHAYSFDLLKALGTAVGFGQNVSIRSFLTERRRVIEELVGAIVPPGARVADVLRLPLWQFVDTTDRFWTEMENKGLTRQDVSTLSWGRAGGTGETINEIFRSLFPRAEAELDRRKKAENAVDLKDLTRGLDALRSTVPQLRAQLNAPPKYLFIDEFQDTDDTQIRLATWIHQQLGTRLFVVGDVKQSIYRFRGATHIAFNSLADAIGADNLSEYRLVRNYRTDAELLRSIEPLFTVWGRQKWLNYDPKLDRLEAANPSGSAVECVAVRKKKDVHAVTLQLIRDALARLPAPAPDDVRRPQVAVLVRTNNDVETVRSWCDQVGIFCQVETGGDFYTTRPVMDLIHLVHALLYPDDSRAMVNLYQCSFSERQLDWTTLRTFAGQVDRMLSVLRPYPPHTNWDAWLLALRTLPVLTVLRTAIREANPARRAFEQEFQRLRRLGGESDEASAQAQLVALRYSRNMDKLLQLLHAQFAAESVTLSTLHRFLTLKRATDRREDQAPLSDEELMAPLICKNVHKAKGQEFHTVVVPLTGHPFYHDMTELLLTPNAGRWEAGWMIRDGKQRYANDLYPGHRTVENDEARMEETRLLYVALTRAQHRLLLVQRIGKSDCWSELLELAQ